MLRQEWAKHITERNSLQHQAHVEFDAIKQHDLMVKNAPVPAHVSKIQKTQVFLQAWHASQGIVEQVSRQQATPHSKTKAQHLDALQRQNEAHPGIVRDRYAVREIKERLNAVPEVYGLNGPVERLNPIHSSLQRPPTPDFQIPGEFDVEDLMYSQPEGTPNTLSDGVHQYINPPGLESREDILTQIPVTERVCGRRRRRSHGYRCSTKLLQEALGSSSRTSTLQLRRTISIAHDWTLPSACSTAIVAKWTEHPEELSEQACGDGFPTTASLPAIQHCQATTD